MSKYLVTGDEGQLGAKVSEALRADGDKPYGKWEIKCALDLAVDAIVWALKTKFDDHFAVFNIGDKGNRYLVTYNEFSRRG